MNILSWLMSKCRERRRLMGKWKWKNRDVEMGNRWKCQWEGKSSGEYDDGEGEDWLQFGSHSGKQFVAGVTRRNRKAERGKTNLSHTANVTPSVSLSIFFLSLSLYLLMNRHKIKFYFHADLETRRWSMCICMRRVRDRKCKERGREEVQSQRMAAITKLHMSSSRGRGRGVAAGEASQSEMQRAIKSEMG